VVHGNPSNVKEVFLTGATSKLGRAIALYLCRKKTSVLVRLLAFPSFFLTRINGEMVLGFLCGN
jgi:hypothetical protein